MKTRTLITLALLTIFLDSFAQSTNFRFEDNGSWFLKFRTNAAGDRFIEQTNTQSSLFFGFGSGANNAHPAGSTNAGEFNSAFGQFCLRENTTGQRNTALGYSCLDENTTGSSNVGIGFLALSSNTAGVNNIAIGDISLRDNLVGQNNIAIGHSALVSTTGFGNVAIGSGAGLWEGDGTDNTYLGRPAGSGQTSNPSDRQKNTMVGAYAGRFVTSSGNVFLGYGAGENSTASDGNQLYIANSDADSTEALIYGEFNETNPSEQILRVNGKFSVDGLYTMPTSAPASGQFLRSTSIGANATLSWANIDAPWSTGAGDDVLYEDGDVGIGLGNALYRLDVQESNSSYVARFRNANTTNQSRGVIIQAGPVINPTSATYYALFLDGNGTNIGGVRGNSSGGVQYATTSDRRLKQNIQT